MIPGQLIDLVQAASSIAVLTGAGVSKESGIPTFREAQTGLWEKYDPTELATPQAFQRNPRLVWEWYQWRRNLISKAEPNPGHIALAEFEAKIPEFTLITQNIDSLHSKAGSKKIVELHGNIARTKCFDSHHVVDDWEETEDLPPKCPICRSLLRPDVVWFNEGLPADAINSAIQIAQSVGVFFSVGTSALVQPAASLPLIAKRSGAVLVEVNPDDTPITHFADFVLKGTSGDVLPEIAARI